MVLLLLTLASAVAAASVGEKALVYDETVSAQYIWIAQATGFEPDQIKNWTCGVACDTVKAVRNVYVTKEGFPLQTLGMVAEYGADECVVAFRGSKTLLNYLLDDFLFRWSTPYGSCPTCKVHEGFYLSWMSLRKQTVADLAASGCDKKPLRITGHSLGASMAALAAFDLADNFTVKHVYTYGQPRIGNQAWVDAFQEKMANIPYFRVTDYMDAVPHLPPRGGFQHPGPEVFYSATKMGSYKTCPTGEDKTCSGQYYLLECLMHTCCHCSYLGMNPCKRYATAPQCMQPSKETGDHGQYVVV